MYLKSPLLSQETVRGRPGMCQRGLPCQIFIPTTLYISRMASGTGYRHDFSCPAREDQIHPQLRIPDDKVKEVSMYVCRWWIQQRSSVLHSPSVITSKLSVVIHHLFIT